MPLLSYLGVPDFFCNAKDRLKEGYERVRRTSDSSGVHLTRRAPSQYAVFRVALMNRWLVIVSGAKLTDELCKYSEDKASFAEAIEDVQHSMCTNDSSRTERCCC